MKTSVVLLALATAALAAPALHEQAFENQQHIPAKFLSPITRERKSTLESSFNTSPEVPTNLPETSQISEFGISGRTFGLKKPIIIKKKIGSSYQVYRDSDEEKQDSPVPCRKQVRVNLCDEHSVAKSGDLMKSSTIEDPNIDMTEDDLKHSITLAKEVVENLQKDMRKVEDKPKTATWKHEDSESDVELHQDIEVARQALEHVQNSLSHSEDLNSQDDIVKEAVNIEDLPLPLASTEEARFAQWKKAVASIQRNVELVENIERSFKSSHDDLPQNEDTVTSINKHDLHNLVATKENMRATENFELKGEQIPTVDHSEHDEKSSEQANVKINTAEKDMMESASMVTAAKLQGLTNEEQVRVMLHHTTKTRGALEKKHDPETMDSMISEDAKERSTDIEALPETENTEDYSVNKIKPIDGAEPLFEKQSNAELLDITAFKHEINIGETEDNKMEMKSAEHITEKDNEPIFVETKTHARHHPMGHVKEDSFEAKDIKEDNISSLKQMKTHESMAHKDHFGKGKVAAMTSDSLIFDQPEPTIETTFQTKTADDLSSIQHHKHLIDQSQMRWAQDHFNNERGIMKSAGEPDHTHIHNKHEHHVHHHKHNGPHHVDNSGHMGHHEHFMPHGKAADMDNAASYFVNMRDSDSMGQEGQRFRWRPTQTRNHESARSAYGAPAPLGIPSSGAVGLFPNANIGGCGIPLLLSCNPSVVSGSLAKAHSAPYSAPAYRTEDDFNFHSKRDIKKTQGIVKTLNRTTTPISKPSTILVAKQ